MPTATRNDKIYRYLKADASSIWFRYSVDSGGAYQFLFQTGTSAPDQALVSTQDAFTKPGSPAPTLATGNVIDPAIISTGDFADGSAAAPSITFLNEQTTGLYRAGTGLLGVTVLGTQVGQFAAGQLQMANGSAAAPSYSFTSDTGTGFYRDSASKVGISLGGSEVVTLGIINSGLRMQAVVGGAYLDLNGAGNIGLTAAGTNQSITLTPSGTADVIVSVPDASNGRMAEFRRNGKTITVYSDNSSASFGTETNHPLDFFTNFSVSRMRLALSGNLLVGGLTTDGTGVLQFATGNSQASGITFRASRSLIYSSADGATDVDSLAGASLETALNIRQGSGLVGRLETSGGNFVISTSGAFSTVFKTNGATALTLDSSQNATFAANITLPVSASYQWNGRSRILSDGDGLIRLNDAAGTNFGRLMFGGTTSSFPSLKRNSASLEVRLADDSGYSAIMVDNLRVTGTAVTAAAGQISYGASTASTVGAAGGASALPALPLGYVIINVAGTAAKIPYYNN